MGPGAVERNNSTPTDTAEQKGDRAATVTGDKASQTPMEGGEGGAKGIGGWDGPTSVTIRLKN
jgi:hypothetical protein